MMLLDDALGLEDFAEERFLVDVTGHLPDLRFVLLGDQRAIWHVQHRQLCLMSRHAELRRELLVRQDR